MTPEEQQARIKAVTDRLLGLKPPKHDDGLYAIGLNLYSSSPRDSFILTGKKGV